MTTYRIKQIGSLGTGWAIKRDGIISRSGPSAAAVGAYLDALLACASEYDAGDIAEAITARPAPTYEERLAVFSPSGRPEPSRDPFKKA
jgi:hypothetical protein